MKTVIGWALLLWPWAFLLSMALYSAGPEKLQIAVFLLVMLGFLALVAVTAYHGRRLLGL